MSDDLRSGPPDSEVLCSWCGKRLPSDGPEAASVCERCVRLLKGAGLSDEEIFAPPKKMESAFP
jgi:hypothetical protein